MVNNKCANCGGMYEYSPTDKALKCVKCGGIKRIQSVFNIPPHDYIDGENNFDNSWVKEVRRVKCKSCGAEVILNRYEIMNECSYCGNTALINVKENVSISPDAVIPFRFNKNQAIKYFQEGLRKKLFIPNALKKKAPSVNISSNYIGAYIFSGKASVKYSGILVYETTSRNSKGETETTTHTKHVNGTIQHWFKNRIYECSSNLTQSELTHIMPYELIDLKGYKADYLFGSSAEYSDKSVSIANKELESELRYEIKNKILNKHNCDRVRTLDLNIEYNEKKYIYTLLPIYVFNYKYKEKHYKTVMNGQTGKLGGNVPKSTIKIALFVVFITLLALGVLGFILI